MRRAVLDEPTVDQAGIILPVHLMPLVERRERALQRRQPVERHAGEIVMLEVIVGVQEREVPKPVAAHQRAPFRGVVGIDVVVLPQTVQREGDREDEEDRKNVGPQGGRAASFGISSRGKCCS